MTRSTIFTYASTYFCTAQTSTFQQNSSASLSIEKRNNTPSSKFTNPILILKICVRISCFFPENEKKTFAELFLKICGHLLKFTKPNKYLVGHFQSVISRAALGSARGPERTFHGDPLGRAVCLPSARRLRAILPWGPCELRHYGGDRCGIGFLTRNASRLQGDVRSAGYSTIELAEIYAQLLEHA